MRKSLLTLAFFSLISLAYAQEDTPAFLAKSGTAVNAVAWSPDGKYFATSWNNTTILWEAESNNISAIYSNSPDDTINPFTDIMALEFAQDSKSLLSVHNNNTAMVHSLTSDSSISALITGNGRSIPDATYVGNNIRIIIPMDEKNVYECIRRQANGTYALEKRMQLDYTPLAVSSNGRDEKILITTEDGQMHLIDTKDWNEMGSGQVYIMSQLYPEFSPDMEHYVYAYDGENLMVASIYNQQEYATIHDDASFAYKAIFSADGKKIIAGTTNGFVKIFDIETGIEENAFQLEYDDVAKSLAVSPDDEFILIGTRKGYIYRWSLHGYVFDEEIKKYVDEDGNEYQIDFGPKEYSLKDGLTFALGYNNVNVDYYAGGANLDIGYRYYYWPPVYFGADLILGVSQPASKFPYSYQTGGTTLEAPRLYSFVNTVTVGLTYFNKTYDFSLFTEASIGYSLRFLYNNSFENAYFSALYPGFVVQTNVGFSYKWFRAWGGFYYDSNLDFMFDINAGVKVPLEFKWLNRKRHKTTKFKENAEVIETGEMEEPNQEENNLKQP